MKRTRIAPFLTLIAVLSLISCSMQPETFQLAFKTPSETIYTNDTVELSVTTADQPYERIELVQDSTVVAELVGSTTYTWDTTELDEGSYEVTARAYQGDTVAEAGPLTVVVDRTAPTIAGTEPTDGDAHVESDTAITITFSEAIDPQSISDDSLILARSDGSPIAVSRTVSDDETSVAMTILGTPALPLELVANASNTIRDRAGNRLGNGTTWGWTVPAWIPLGGPVEAQDERRVGDPSFALDNTGTPYVAYQEFADSDFRIYVSRWNGTGWEQIGGAVSSTAAGVNAFVPSLKIDDSNRPVVAYEERPSTFEEDIYVKRFEGGSWTQLGTSIDIDNSQDAFSPDLAIDQNGLPVVAWVEYNGTYDEVHVKRWTGSSFVEVGAALNIGTGGADDPDVEINSDHEITVAWSEIRSSQGNIYYAYWAPNASLWVSQPQDPFGDAEPLDRVESTGGYGPSLSSYPDYYIPYVAWYEAGELYVGRPSPNYTFYEGDTFLNVNPSRYADSLQTAVDSRERLVVAWTESGLSSDDDIFVKRYEGGFVLLSAPVYEGPYSGESPSLVIGPDDVPYVAYQAYTDATQSSDIRVVRYNGWE